MTNDAGTASHGGQGSGGQLARFVVDPAEHRSKVRKQWLALLGFSVLAVICIGGLLSGEVTRRLFMIVLLGIVGVLGAGGAIWRLIRLRAERRTGDDAIDLVVTENELVGPGGLAIPWYEVAGVEMSASTPVTAQGTRDAERSAALVRILLTDPRSTLERTTTPLQAAAVRTSEGAPHVRVELGERSAADVALLRAVLDAELAPRGQRVTEVRG
ncbi:hypothetical protein ACPYO6_09670 [Georgenia sp. Z1344]|uniref:hypothetical protein n=1 Tax=Georgenia sp. Z1344 TaxID=3416706 RepID=UPI003CEA0157